MRAVVLLAPTVAEGNRLVRDVEELHGAKVVTPRSTQRLHGLRVAEVYVDPRAVSEPGYSAALSMLRRLLFTSGEDPRVKFIREADAFAWWVG